MLGLYWGAAGLIIRATGVLRLKRPLLQCLLIAAIWVTAAEWVRGIWPWHGLPWLYLGHTQTPALWMCQIADITGVAGISFLLAMINGWIALWILGGRKIAGLAASGLTIVAITAAVISYGLFRFQTEKFTAGPKVLLVQPNYPQDNSGQKGADPQEMIDFHLNQTRQALMANNGVDLVVWSETMLPPMNAWRQYPGSLMDVANQEIMSLAYLFHVGVISGGEYGDDFERDDDGYVRPNIRRNVTYFYDRAGMFSDLRYEKIHLVPFGEFVPFKDGFPALNRLLIRLGPPDMKYYSLEAGDENHLTVFDLAKTDPDAAPWSIVTPICFEDIDATLCAQMCRPDAATPDRKRAEILVNLTNDGWFAANENSQHLQAAVFRSIENRAPTARAVNTGISGFVDPLGRTSGLLAARTAAVSVGTLQLCARITFFTLHGPVFSWLCAVVTGFVILVSVVGKKINQRGTETQRGNT
jgi:apolipoprotein N-acyltransferase